MIQVKIRDIPYEEVKWHFNGAPDNAKELWEEKLRNKIITLTGDKCTEHLNGLNVIGYCTTLSLSNNSNYFWVCEICAEIGD